MQDDTSSLVEVADARGETRSLHDSRFLAIGHWMAE